MTLHHDQTPAFWRTRWAIGFVVFGAVSAYMLLTEHRAHYFGALPFILLIACPLAHVFMHRGHGHPVDGGDSEASHSGERK